MYKIFFTRNSKKDLSDLVETERKRIIFKVNQLNFPFPASLNIKKLSGHESFYRLRISKIRIIFMINFELKEIVIRKISYRKDIYKSF